MKILLRPIRRDTWSGIIKYRSCNEDIGSYFTRSGRLYTGLTDDEAERLGGILGFDLKPSSEYWRDFFIRTSGKDLYLDIEDPADELKYLFLKSHKRVKNSLLERKATANFVLINQGEEDKRTNIFNRLRRRAIREFDSMNSDDIRKCLRIYGHNADRLSNDAAENRMFDIVQGDPKSFLKKWVDNESRDTEALLERAVSKNIIRKNKNLYKYGSDIIGHTILEVVDFIDDPKNQDIKIAIMKQVEGKETIKDIKFDSLSDNEAESIEKGSEETPIKKNITEKLKEKKVVVENLGSDTVEEDRKAKLSEKTNKEDTI